MLPNEHGFFYQDGAKAITANNPMADLRNIIWVGGDNKNNTLNRRRPLSDCFFNFLIISQNVAICPKTFSNRIEGHC